MATWQLPIDKSLPHLCSICYLFHPMRNSLTILLAIPVFFSACAKQEATVVYNLKFSAEAKERQEELIDAGVRMVSDRLESMGIEGADVRKVQKGTKAQVTVLLKEHPEAAQVLTEKIVEPFNVRIMKQVPQEQATVTIGESEGYAETCLTEEHIFWFTAEGTAPLPGSATIEFTEEGKRKKREVFAQHIGQELGVFVRNFPAYKFKVEDEDVNSDTLIMRIPNANVARIFADDMNTALHVTFTPVQP